MSRTDCSTILDNAIDAHPKMQIQRLNVVRVLFHGYLFFPNTYDLDIQHIIRISSDGSIIINVTQRY